MAKKPIINIKEIDSLVDLCQKADSERLIDYRIHQALNPPEQDKKD